MVRGLDIFSQWFANHRDQYVLIGGSAAQLTMEEQGLEFRATKDLDVVLIVEALTPTFAERFWAFIAEGGYEIRQAADTGKPCFYRFQRPANERFPFMVELFTRTPDLLPPVEAGRLTPIPIDESVSSLSAILLDDSYYEFVLGGRREIDGVPMIGEDRLIPLKALAWLELGERREKGEKVDAKDVRKHLNDVIRLSALLAETSRVDIDERIAQDMRRFLKAAARETLDMKALGHARQSLAEVLDRIGLTFGLAELASAEESTTPA